MRVLPNTVISEVYIDEYGGCVGDSIVFVDASTSSYPITKTRWWWDYDGTTIGYDTMVYFFSSI